MTPDELKEKLIASGWAMGSQPRETGCDWYAWARNREGIPDCACNDKPPSFVLTPYHIDMRSSKWRSVEFSVCGEMPNGRWVDLRVYSVPMDEAMDAIEPARKALFAAWTAAVEVGK